MSFYGLMRYLIPANESDLSYWNTRIGTKILTQCWKAFPSGKDAVISEYGDPKEPKTLMKIIVDPEACSQSEASKVYAIVNDLRPKNTMLRKSFELRDDFTDVPHKCIIIRIIKSNDG